GADCARSGSDRCGGGQRYPRAGYHLEAERPHYRSPCRADAVRLCGAADRTAPMQPLQARVFELRDNLTAYDAMYVALAERLVVPLLTDDAKLAGAPGHRAEIQQYPGGSAAPGGTGRH